MVTKPSTKNESEALRPLGAAHSHVDALFNEMIEAAELNLDTWTLRKTWRRMERGLMAHLDAEEKFLFPELEPKHPELIRELRDEHEEIRRLLDEIGIAVDLHFLRDTNVHQLIEVLRRHAIREEETVYKWAVDELSVDNLTSLLGQLTEEAA